MKVYTYTEARRHLARLLEEARQGGAIRIRRRDGSVFELRPVTADESSPLDVPGVGGGFNRKDIIAAIRESREREPVRGDPDPPEGGQ